MTIIGKYTLGVKEKQTIDLPLGADMFRVDDVDGQFFLWAIIDTEQEEMVTRHLEFYKTGQEITTPTNDLKMIGFCKLFIMQELGLYVFENLKKYNESI